MTIPSRLSVLILGSGGREHALAIACATSPLLDRLWAAPGNPGIASCATCCDLDIMNAGQVTAFCRKEGVDLVIIGPEAPLCAGLADDLRQSGFAVFGPGQVGAQLEGSKAFSKEFMLRHGIPTARAQSFDQLEPALAALHQCDFPVVIKASGLAAGKGVIIAQSRSDAESAVTGMLSGQWFGESGHRVVIEEYLEGVEASLMLIVCGQRYFMLPVSQDHKRVGDGDTGPNTGGMGAYAPARIISESLLDEITTTIIQPSLSGLETLGADYRGVLYIGLMLTSRGPRVLEYNVRFGDPEAQVLLPLMDSDPLMVLWECASGRLDTDALRLGDRSSIIVVLAAEGYPEAYLKGSLITLPDRLPENVVLIHAGTARDSAGRLVTAGGRVLGVRATGPTLAEAAQSAYAICRQIDWPGCHYRRDIGARQLHS